MNRLEKQKQFEQEFKEKAKQLHNDKYDYSNVVYVNSRTKVKIICPKHGGFEQLPSSHLQGNGCPECAREWTDEHKENHAKSSRKSRGMTTDEWIQRAKQVHGDKYDYSLTEYVNQRTNVKIICPKHGLFEQKADSHIRGNGCRLCGLQSENHIGVHNWSDEQRQKIAKTCQERYGATRYLDSDAGKQHIMNIKSTPEFRQKMSDIISIKDILFYLMQAAYFILLTYFTGSTLGKKIFQIRVVSTEERKMTFFEVAFRETVGRFLSALILSIGYIMIAVDKNKRGLHDILSDTNVVYYHEKKVYTHADVHYKNMVEGNGQIAPTPQPQPKNPYEMAEPENDTVEKNSNEDMQVK